MFLWNNVSKLSSLCPNVCCWLFGVRLGCGLGWFVGSNFSLCGGLRWVGSVVWWVGLGWRNWTHRQLYAGHLFCDLSRCILVNQSINFICWQQFTVIFVHIINIQWARTIFLNSQFWRKYFQQTLGGGIFDSRCRNSLLKRYKLYKTVGLEKEFPMTGSVSLALRMTRRWLRCRCLKSSEDQLQQPYSVINAPANSLCKAIFRRYPYRLYSLRSCYCSRGERPHRRVLPLVSHFEYIDRRACHSLLF